ncbi:MAG: bifunctional 23S rRNA (guanine(2069)-N(7))-methyltransferase RlmK/23S rRNA (guanine(2445)-N(2))-methyltransferase RlmL [Pseudomonadales bacterium]|nr:bifunctional 23S rRNA (guanine(2069)-N(7))-methyltransferase RlmK/23S rRNA (guanine(2445)-N(2))-methyltransferase RlmL [Pseudomonadales bacterium]MDG1441977.1 bifunctional 23S rRNA (guanine(2069)-N(7))-methyltransferase RlmK/23S rRNA (guanine(2445)-N(2))-methyltransferase RlmL [Pseudomonadales bacterium]
MTNLTYFATAAKGIETLLLEELRGMGISDVKETRAGVHFTADLEAAYRACLWSRLANRILLPLASFDCPSDDELYRKVKALDWSKHMSVDQTLAIDASVTHSNMNHSQFAAQRMKDAVVDYFREKTGDRPSVQPSEPDIQLNLYINDNKAQVYLDLSGTSLHVRGYRSRGSAAPLKENLAAAILYRADWPRIAKQGGAFVDFMCGSGTLPIEAALMACDIAPGIDRDYYGMFGWAQHDAELWQRLKKEANERRAEGLKLAPKIMGFDHHPSTLERTSQHVAQAGLQKVIKIEHQDVFEFSAEVPENGLVVINPPYGHRLGKGEDLTPLYHQIGQVLIKRFEGWQASVFTDDKDKGKLIGIRAKKIHSLFNGALPCKLLHFDIVPANVMQSYRLPRLISQQELSESALGFLNRLKKNLKKTERWAKRQEVSCFRVYDADLPDYAVAIDLYTDAETAKQWLNIQEYEAPKTIDPDKAKLRLREAVSVAKLVFDVPDEQLYLKSRRRQRGDAQYEKLAEERVYHQVEEGACHFLVNFEDYLDTGLFLDHRPLRLRIGQESNNKAILNLFAYTGTATVHAAVGGASRSLTIDMSNTYIDWATRNMDLNAINDPAHRFLQADCIAWLENPTEKDKFDIIFLDPPSFSNSKRMQNVFDVQEDHAKLIRQAMELLTPDGVLFFSNNLRRFKLANTELDEFDVADITDQTIPADFRQRKHIHRCWEIRFR